MTPGEGRKQIALPPVKIKDTLSGFARGWIIFLIVINIAGCITSLQTASQAGLAGLMVSVLVVFCVYVAGLFLLYYKKAIGIYVALIANLMTFMVTGNYGSYSVILRSGLLQVILTYFFTRQQISYCFWQTIEPVSKEEVNSMQEGHDTGEQSKNDVKGAL
jgi:hypothetical protein